MIYPLYLLKKNGKFQQKQTQKQRKVVRFLFTWKTAWRHTTEAEKETKVEKTVCTSKNGGLSDVHFILLFFPSIFGRSAFQARATFFPIFSVLTSTWGSISTLFEMIKTTIDHHHHFSTWNTTATKQLWGWEIRVDFLKKISITNLPSIINVYEFY